MLQDVVHTWKCRQQNRGTYAVEPWKALYILSFSLADEWCAVFW
jgi:hypothetical protein